MDTVVAEQQQKITMLETKLSQYKSELGSLKKQATGKDIHSVAANAAAAVILKKSRMAQQQQQQQQQQHQMSQAKAQTSSSNLQKIISNTSNHFAGMKTKVKSPIRKASRAERKAAQRPEGTTRYWSQAEHERFLSACRMFGARKYIQIAEYVGTRSAKQVRTHSQKYEIRLVREKTTNVVGSNTPHPLELAAEAADALAITMKKQNKSHKKKHEAEQDQEQMDNLPTSPLKSAFYGKNANEIYMSPMLSASTSIRSVSQMTAARATLSESLSLSSMASDDYEGIADEEDEAEEDEDEEVEDEEEEEEEEEDLDSLDETENGAAFSDPALLGVSAAIPTTNNKASWHNSLLLDDNFSLLPIAEHQLEAHDAFRLDVSAPLDAFMTMDEVWANDHEHEHVGMHDTTYHGGVDDWLISEDQF